MKRVFLILGAVALGIVNANAQKNPDVLFLGKNESKRAEMILPQVNGYNIYKADLHTHTVFSDGAVLPKVRIAEAFNDGLDIIALTDHIEFRTNEEAFLLATRGYHKSLPEAKNHLIHREPADKDGILADLNLPYKLAEKYSKRYDIMVIRGVEISRHPENYGHFNALFVKDANKIYDPDIEKSFRNAKAQGALIMHNHPGWRRSTTDKNEFHERVYSEGLIDGIEIINGHSACPKLIKRCLDEKLFVGAGTDMHTGSNYEKHCRPCTFIFATERTESEIKKALEEGRTLAYSHHNVMGEKQLLSALFNASIIAKVISTSSSGEMSVALTNTSSIPYHIRRGKKGNGLHIAPFQTGIVKLKKEQKLEYYVTNMWYADGDTPNGGNPKILIEWDK